MTGKPPSARRALLVDLSETGVFLRTSKHLRKGDEVYVIFDVGRARELTTLGRVARVQAPDGVGIEFAEVSQELRSFVRQLVGPRRIAGN